MNAPVALYLLGAMALLLCVLAAISRLNRGRFTNASRTWLMIAAIFAAVIAWVLVQRGV